ncbi:MAG: HAD family hydrolase [Candidatus Doudnabacteria bacterium]|nr:HAD family hydrolase [Candidatus Doudnabacteria bacterium]
MAFFCYSLGMVDNNKIIIFDMDGVLFDTIPFARKVFLETHPGVTEEMYNEIHSGNFHQEAAKYLSLHISESEEEKNKRHAEYAEKKSQSKLFEGIKDLLTELRNLGYILVLNTNAYERNALPLLKNSQIENLFGFIASAETSKDKVEKFKIIADKYKVSNKEMLFITDALGDIIDADKAGVPAVAVTWGVHREDILNREKHFNLKNIVNTVSDLKQVILKLL